MSTATGSCQSRVVVSICLQVDRWMCKAALGGKMPTQNQKLTCLCFSACSAAGAGPTAGEEEDALPTYKDAFPPLPEKAASPEGTQETANAWTSKIRPLKSSVITQV